MVLAKAKALMSTKFISNILVHDRQVSEVQTKEVLYKKE